MQITVYGATGTFGRFLVEQLRDRGHSVIAAHRGIGVDSTTGEGVTEAAEGSDVLVDCVNLMTNSRHRALDFFSRSSRSIALAAAENSSATMVCLSIAFRPEVTRSSLMGYYQAKELQERVYRRLVPADQLLVFRSTQWFELAETMTISAGPIAFAPKLRVQPLAAAEAARMMADSIDAGERGTLEVAGPQVTDLADIARRIVEAGRPRSSTFGTIIGVPVPGPLSREGLIPAAPRLSGLTVDDWLDSRTAAN